MSSLPQELALASSIANGRPLSEWGYRVNWLELVVFLRLFVAGPGSECLRLAWDWQVAASARQPQPAL